MPTRLTLADIAAMLHVPAAAGPRRADGVTGIATLADAGPDELSFLGSDAYLKQFATTKAAAVIVQKRVKLPREARRTPVFVVDDADLAVAKVLEHLRPARPAPAGRHASAAFVASSAASATAPRSARTSSSASAAGSAQNVVLHPGVVRRRRRRRSATTASCSPTSSSASASRSATA